ncbi:MAG: type IX secretion system plug protein domain-containing protein [Bacteroidia bacterium]
MRLYVFCLGLAFAQLRDTICEPQLYSVQFYRGNNVLSFPYLGLGEKQYLTLEFDEVGVETPSDFWVQVRLCSGDWRPSTLASVEYWNGYPMDRITDYAPSYNTRVHYIHYLYRLENRFTRSGLYVIEVFRDREPSHLVLRRRFYVVENLVRILPNLQESQIVTGARQGVQAISFKVFPAQLRSTQMYQEFSCMLLQNGRWDNARNNLKPTFLQSDYMEYRFQPALDMSAGVEFRMLDLRSIFRRRSFQIDRTLWTDSGIVVILMPERPRAGWAYTRQIDLNGRFIIQAQDGGMDTSRQWRGRDEIAATQGDYFWVEFRLQVATPYPKPLYVAGGFMSWCPDSRFELRYDEDAAEYRRRILLKQGVYDYLYALWDEERHVFDTDPVEGTYFETENTYAIIVLYRGFTDREDRIVGHYWLN